MQGTRFFKTTVTCNSWDQEFNSSINPRTNYNCTAPFPSLPPLLLRSTVGPVLVHSPKTYLAVLWSIWFKADSSSLLFK